MVTPGYGPGMDEGEVIRNTRAPATTRTLLRDLRALGIREGDVLIVHSSLSRIGWVAGGPQAVVDALLEAVGPAGTLTMPGHSGGWSEPSRWQNPPAPEDWWPVVRAETPAFDPARTPLHGMGAVPELFARYPGTLRSHHPRVSHLANGPAAEAIVSHHPLGSGLGPESPLGRLRELRATVVLLGVGHANNTSLHLAEHLAEWPGKAPILQGSAVRVDGERRWVEYEECDLDADDFDAAGAAFGDATGLVRHGLVGTAPTMVMPMDELVSFGVTWLSAHRPIA